MFEIFANRCFVLFWALVIAITVIKAWIIEIAM